MDTNRLRQLAGVPLMEATGNIDERVVADVLIEAMTAQGVVDDLDEVLQDVYDSERDINKVREYGNRLLMAVQWAHQHGQPINVDQFQKDLVRYIQSLTNR